MADEKGFYRSDGIQSTGTALKKGNVNTEIYNSGGKIYPRYKTESDVVLSSSSTSYLHQTCRSGYNSNYEKGTWRTDKAYQGYYNGSSGSSEEAVGHFFSADGKKMSIGDNVSSFDVTYVKITMHRGGGGWNQGYSNEGYLRMSNLSSCSKGGVYRGARFSDIDMNLVKKYSYRFDIPAIGSSVTITGNNKDHALCKFIKSFLSESKAQCLAIYNGETSGDAGYAFSYHYASFDSFTMEVKIDRTIKL